MIKRDSTEPSFPLGPALDFLQRLWQLNRALEKVSSLMEKRLGITAQQRMVLRCVGKYPGLTAGQLATLLHVDPGTVSASLRRLESKRLLERKRDPRDKRRVSLGLTTRGRTLDRPSGGTVENAVDRLLETVRADELESMVSVIVQLTALLQDEANG